MSNFESPCHTLYVDLDMVTAQFILQSEYPLKTLVAVSQDFPKYQRKISKMALNETLKEGFQDNMMRTRDNRAKVWLNNQPVPHHKMNPFKYVATLSLDTR